jgi:signal transduction histidine kinase
MKEQIFLAALSPGSGQKRFALIVAMLVPIPFIAILPIAQIQLPEVDSFIPITNTVIFINDSITATLLLALFSISCSPSFLALAAGFLYTAFVAVPQALTLPGAFAPTGLLGARLQTPAWLNEFWHLGLPCAAIAYALLKRVDVVNPMRRAGIPFAILATVTSAFAITCGLVWLTTRGADFLPAIMTDLHHSNAPWTFIAPVLLSIVAIWLIWSRQDTALDLWLLIVLEIWTFEALLFPLLTTRYSLIWYGGRAFAVFAASLVLLFLLSQTTMLYARILRSHTLLERERHNKLLNAQAITAAIAHEIKQPLAAITLNAGAARRWLRRATSDYGEALAALDRITNDSLRASEVFDNIRALFGGTDQIRQHVDINEIIGGVTDSFRAQLRDRGILFRLELAAELPLINGHKGQLREVIFNLVNNALEAMDGVTNRVHLLRVRTQIHGHDSIAVAVEDSGPGIDPGKLDTIFTAFVTTKSRGTGLGLAICRMIVESHGGRLAASSDGKNGALLQFVLPIEPATAPPHLGKALAIQSGPAGVLRAEAP